MMLHQACVDDSGTGGRGIFALSGYLLPVEDWKSFADKWDAALHEPRHLDYLKMKEAAKLEKQFKGWKASERDLKLRKLVSVLRSYDVLAVESYVGHNDYSRFVKGKLAEQFDDPYFFCFYDLIIGTLQYQKKKTSRLEGALHFRQPR
jgi:hypothetical protein